MCYPLRLWQSTQSYGKRADMVLPFWQYRLFTPRILFQWNSFRWNMIDCNCEPRELMPFVCFVCWHLSGRADKLFALLPFRQAPLTNGSSRFRLSLVRSRTRRFKSSNVGIRHRVVSVRGCTLWILNASSFLFVGVLIWILFFEP